MRVNSGIVVWPSGGLRIRVFSGSPTRSLSLNFEGPWGLSVAGEIEISTGQTHTTGAGKTSTFSCWSGSLLAARLFVFGAINIGEEIRGELNLIRLKKAIIFQLAVD